MLLNSIQETFQYGSYTVMLETGVLARQATSAVLVRMGDTTVLVTVVCSKFSSKGSNFFPLAVHYQERSYAGGRIPGGYFKREGRPTEKEVLTSRLIDRPLRPLFPEGFHEEVQIIATVLSADPAVSADIPALLGASAALAISGLPWQGPIGAARVGYTNGQYSLNPSTEQLNSSELDLVVAGTGSAILMVESEAVELSEDIVLEGVLFGQQQLQAAIQAIKKLMQVVNKPAWDWKPPFEEKTLEERLFTFIREPLIAAYQIPEKAARRAKLEALKADVMHAFINRDSPANGLEGGITPQAIQLVLARIEEKLIRGQILLEHSRIDGRDPKTIRPITISTSLLPRTHGSALFTRGETQALVVATLGTDRDAQLVEALEGEGRDSFLLHYNFPPYSVGEVAQIGGTKRREIGHGNLAKRALRAVLPSDKQFPYVLRVVSEIMESNGSSSMATVCGTSLALMDAGVPIKKPVAGIAMGLIKEGDRFVILSDILGDEDHLGDMDFKVAGTAEGITALQMDIKTEGITQEILREALQQAREGRLHILDIMNATLALPQQEVSRFAPRIITLEISPSKIRNVIGKGGITIRSLTEETGTLIDIGDDGLVRISAPDSAACQVAVDRIKEITTDIEVGDIYEGPIVKLTDFGAFITILPGRDGLLHISQISEVRVESISGLFTEGQIVRVKVVEIDRQGRIRLSMRGISASPSTVILPNEGS